MDIEVIKQAIPETITVILGFVIFFWVLKRFAWGPILGVLDERQKKIEDSFAEIKRLQDDAAEAHGRYEEKLRDIEAEARAKIQEAVADGRQVATEITEKAREDALLIVQKAKQSVELELAQARKQLREDIVDLTLSATERIIHERLTEAKDRELVGSFIDQLEKKRSG